MDERDSAIGIRIGLTTASATATPTNGTAWATVRQRPQPAVRVSVRSVARGRQWTLASSGSAAAARQVRSPAAFLASGDRPAEDHDRCVERQLAHLLGVALALRDDREVALIELRRGTPPPRPRTLAGSSAVHSASVVWPVWSIRMSRDIAALLGDGCGRRQSYACERSPSRAAPDQARDLPPSARPFVSRIT